MVPNTHPVPADREGGGYSQLGWELLVTPASQGLAQVLKKN